MHHHDAMAGPIQSFLAIVLDIAAVQPPMAGWSVGRTWSQHVAGMN